MAEENKSNKPSLAIPDEPEPPMTQETQSLQGSRTSPNQDEDTASGTDVYDDVDGPLDDSDLSKSVEYWDERACTVEEKEVADLVRKGLLGDAVDEEMKGDFTLDDLPQLHGDEACNVKWTTQKRKPKDVLAALQELSGLGDDELAGVLQACPDLLGGRF